MKEGYIAISRHLKDSWLHPSSENRKYTNYEAWIWIIENARFICSNPVLLNGRLMVIPRGYLSVTVENLSGIFKWDKRKTEKFLKILEKDDKIQRFKINKNNKRSYTLIKVNNYNKYQFPACDICNSEYKSRCHLFCRNKEETLEVKHFIKPTLDEVADYCKKRGSNIDPQKFIDFYESRGWMYGKTKIKDWKAAVRTWENRRKTKTEIEPNDLYMRLSR